MIVLDRAVREGDIESAAGDGFILHRIGPFREEDRTLMAMCRSVELLNSRHKFDALMGMYLVKAGYIAAFEAKLLGIPSLVMVRGNDVDREIFRPFNQPYVVGALQMATAIGCVSREAISKCSALVDCSGQVAPLTDQGKGYPTFTEGGVPFSPLAGKRRHKRINYTPNGVDTSLFTPGAPDENLRSALGLGDAVVGFSGEMRFKKGMSHFLAVAEYISERFPAVKFLLVGGVRADSEKEYAELYDDSPILNPDKSGLVETPYIEEPAELCKHYRLMDAIFMPSLWEGMPNACLEAFACGVPAVSSTAGGLRDLIEPGVNGFSFAPGDFSGAANALCDFLSLPAEQRRAMGAKARERILHDYTTEIEIERIMAILNSL